MTYKHGIPPDTWSQVLQNRALFLNALRDPANQSRQIFGKFFRSKEDGLYADAAGLAMLIANFRDIEQFFGLRKCQLITFHDFCRVDGLHISFGKLADLLESNSQIFMGEEEWNATYKS